MICLLLILVVGNWKGGVWKMELTLWIDDGKIDNMDMTMDMERQKGGVDRWVTHMHQERTWGSN